MFLYQLYRIYYYCLGLTAIDFDRIFDISSWWTSHAHHWSKSMYSHILYTHISYILRFHLVSKLWPKHEYDIYHGNIWTVYTCIIIPIESMLKCLCNTETTIQRRHCSLLLLLLDLCKKWWETAKNSSHISTGNFKNNLPHIIVCS